MAIHNESLMTDDNLIVLNVINQLPSITEVNVFEMKTGVQV